MAGVGQFKKKLLINKTIANWMLPMTPLTMKQYNANQDQGLKNKIARSNIKDFGVDP